MITPKLRKRHFYNGVDYIVDEANKTVRLLPDFHKRLATNQMWFGKGFKKITGSAASNILCNGFFDSKFGAFCRMAWISLPMLDDKYVYAGTVIEPKVIDKLRASFLKADPKAEYIEYPAEKYNYDYFAKADPIIGGLPDGLAKPWNILIEIKTTGEANFSKWEREGVPQGYLKQAQMYSYLMGVDRFVIAALFLKKDDYVDPKNLDISGRVLKQYPFKVNRANVEADIKTIKEFYHNYKDSGVSPQWNDRVDAELIEYLKCKDKVEWEMLLEKWDAQGKLNSMEAQQWSQKIK